MPHVTSVGLDVHARPVSAAAFNLHAGEVVQRDFGPEAGPIAEWVLSFESPRAVCESGPTGFALCRELRALGAGCIVGAVSKMQRPAADRRVKNDRRDAAFLAGLPAAPQRRRGPAARRQSRGGQGPVARLDAQPGPARVFSHGQPQGRARGERLRRISDEGPGRRIEMRWGAATQGAFRQGRAH